MKFLVTSDWHPDKSTAGFPRYDDVSVAVEQTVEAAKKYKVDGYIFAGDLCDPDDGPSVIRCFSLMLRTVMRCRDEGIPVYLIPGNHDVFEDGSGNSVLAPFGHLEIEEGRMIWLLDKPEPLALGGDVVLLPLPFTPLSHTYDAEKVVRDFIKANKKTPPAAVLIVGHLVIPGAQPGSEDEMPRGRDVVFPLEACKEIPWPKVMINGHYHHQQFFQDIWIPGSLMKLTFGDSQSRSGWLIVEVP